MSLTAVARAATAVAAVAAVTACEPVPDVKPDSHDCRAVANTATVTVYGYSYCHDGAGHHRVHVTCSDGDIIVGPWELSRHGSFANCPNGSRSLSAWVETT